MRRCASRHEPSVLASSMRPSTSSRLAPQTSAQWTARVVRRGPRGGAGQRRCHADCATTSSGEDRPPAIVRSPDGEVTILDDPPGRPLGCNSPARTHATIELPAGSLVLMYTDGLVDWRQRRGGGDALGELAAIVRDAPLLDPPELVEHVVKAALDGVDALDDVAVVCMSLR